MIWIKKAKRQFFYILKMHKTKKPQVGDLLYSGPPSRGYDESFGMILEIQERVYIVEWYVWENGKQKINPHYYTVRAVKEFKENYEKLKKQISGNKNRSSRNGKAIR